MPRTIKFRGQALLVNEQAPQLTVGDRVRYVIHDWIEGEHTLSGEVALLRPNGTVRVKIGRSADGETDIVHDLPAEALTVVAPVIPIKGER